MLLLEDLLKMVLVFVTLNDVMMTLLQEKKLPQFCFAKFYVIRCSKCVLSCSVCCLQLCPAGMRLDVKKTSHKKLSRFLRAMEAEGLVRVREVSKGVEEIECEPWPIVCDAANHPIRARKGSPSPDKILDKLPNVS